MKEMSGSQGFAKVKEFYSQTAKTKRDSQFSNTVRSTDINNKNNNETKRVNNEESVDDEMIMM